MKNKYGFDLDGTATLPAIKQLINDLYDAGHEIYIVTGGLSDSGEWTMEEREKRLAEHGIKYTKIILCIDSNINKIGIIKAKECNKLGISILFDDSDLYLSTFATASDIQTVKVLS